MDSAHHEQNIEQTAGDIPRDTPPKATSYPSKGRILGIVLGVLLLLTSFLIWRFYENKSSNATNQQKTLVSNRNKPMRIASYYWPGQYWADFAHKKGWFAEQGLAVEMIDTNKDYNQSILDVSEGKLDTQDFYVFNLMNQKAKGSDLVMVVNADTSVGAEAIVVREGIKTIADLKGKKIGIEKELVTEYLLYTILKQNNLSFNDVVRVSATTENLPDMFLSGEVDAVVAWEPYVTEALKKTGSTRLWDTSNIPGIVSAGYVFRKEYIEENPETIQAFVRVWHKTTQYLQQHPEEVYQVVADRNKDTVANVKLYIAIDKTLDLNDNLKAFSYSGGFSSLYGQIQLINRYLRDQQISQEDIEASDILDDRFIRSLVK